MSCKKFRKSQKQCAVWGWIEALFRISVYRPTHFAGTNPLPVMGWWDWLRIGLTSRQLSDGETPSLGCFEKEDRCSDLSRCRNVSSVRYYGSTLSSEASVSTPDVRKTHSHQLSATTVERKTGGALHYSLYWDVSSHINGL